MSTCRDLTTMVICSRALVLSHFLFTPTEWFRKTRKISNCSTMSLTLNWFNCCNRCFIMIRYRGPPLVKYISKLIRQFHRPIIPTKKPKIDSNPTDTFSSGQKNGNGNFYWLASQPSATNHRWTIPCNRNTRCAITWKRYGIIRTWKRIGYRKCSWIFPVRPFRKGLEPIHRLICCDFWSHRERNIRTCFPSRQALFLKRIRICRF